MTVGELLLHLEVFPDNWDLFFGNGNLQFYRTKTRGEKLVQIEFDESTDLITEEEWISVETEKPNSPDPVAVLCRQKNETVLQMTGMYSECKWGVIGNDPALNIVAVTHWCYLPPNVPVISGGDPVSATR